MRDTHPMELNPDAILQARNAVHAATAQRQDQASAPQPKVASHSAHGRISYLVLSVLVIVVDKSDANACLREITLTRLTKN